MAEFKKFSDILGSKKGIDLVFVGLQTDETQAGDPIVRLILKENLPVVYGRMIRDNASSDNLRLEANDVEMVSIGKDALDYIEKLEAEGKQLFVWDKDNEGVSGRLTIPDMRLDVSQALEVWITKDGFAKFAANRRNEARAKQRSNLVTKIREQKTRQEFKGQNLENNAGGAGAGAGSTNPEPVADGQNKQ